jgi:hypothetical protein
MTDNKIYIYKVLENFPTVAKTCRPAIAFFEKDGKDSAVNGFIVGNKYFISSDTFVINDKSDFYLINYLDTPDEDDE